MAKMKCDNCNNAATVHLTEIKHGKKIEKHLCEQCAAQNEGLPVKAHTPINELLTNFVLAHSGLQKESTGTTCDACGITWAEFRQNGLLGCENDYTLFEKDLTPLIQRAHENATHHVGKVPQRRGGTGKSAGHAAERILRAAQANLRAGGRGRRLRTRRQAARSDQAGGRRIAVASCPWSVASNGRHFLATGH